MTIENNKKRFLFYELGLLSLKAALSTRDRNSPVYAKGIKFHQRKKEKQVFRNIFSELEQLHMAGNVAEHQHFEFIQFTAEDVSRKLGVRLHNQRFRIGIAQKLINLHLKYLWVAGQINEPPHCPIDGIIRDKAKINYDWTTNDSIEDYKKAVRELREVSGKRSLAVWELEEFRRRDDEVLDD